MSKQDDARTTPLHHTSTGDHEMWQAHWEAQGQFWRIEPEIDAQRQKYLTERQKIIPDIAQGLYPFKDIKPLVVFAAIEAVIGLFIEISFIATFTKRFFSG